MFIVVEMDNVGDHLDEKFVGPPLRKEEAAMRVAATFNEDVTPKSLRWYKVEKLPYKLVPGFEP